MRTIRRALILTAFLLSMPLLAGEEGDLFRPGEGVG